MELEIIDISDNNRPSGNRKTVQQQKRERARRIQQRKRRRRKILMIKLAILFCMMLLIILFCVILYQLLTKLGNGREEKAAERDFERLEEVIEINDVVRPAIQEDFLTENPYSRPGEKLGTVNNIFVHYTANPGTSAAQNRSYFENLGLTGETSASAHFVIGYDGEIIQCIPLDEIAYAVQKRNYDSISIECCYLEKDGKFTDATYNSLIQMSAWLLKEYNLSVSDMRRHYDEGGKKCPLYYVEHEDAWEQFLADLKQYIADSQV